MVRNDMPNQHGDFIWYELLTTDPEAAAVFYGSVLGWEVNDAGQAGMDYRLFLIGGSKIGGMMALPSDALAAGMRPVWLGYIGVDDVDVIIGATTAAGGTVHMPATDIPGVGRLALLADPQGAVFYVMRGAGEATSTAFSGTEPGHCSWNELTTSDLTAALEFYGARFGWAKGEVMDMGALGDYQFITRDGRGIGAMMTRQPDGPAPMWTYYFRVTDIDAAAASARAGGGQIMHGPCAVPGGDHILIGADPQGALFALVGGRQGGELP